MSLLGLFEWLGATAPSVALHESRYLYLVVLTVHVLTLAFFVGTAIVMDLRLIGVVLRDIRASTVLERLVPWTVGGFSVMVLSGALLFFADPVDKFLNVFFRVKMALLLAAGVNVWVFFRTAYDNVDEWDRLPKPPRPVRVTGGLALLLWAAIITAGRMIPYQQYWFG